VNLMPLRTWVVLFLLGPLLIAGSGLSELRAQSLPQVQERERIFGFAEALFAEGDYFRAITEYKRFIFLFPVDAGAEKAFFRIAESYFKAGRWAESADAFQAFLDRYPGTLMRDEAIYLKGISEKNQKKHKEALSSFELLARSADPLYRDRAAYQQALVLMEREDWKGAIASFSRIPPDSELHRSSNIMAEGLARIDDIPRKDPKTAGILAALLPGSGHLYTERPRDALVAFLLNGAFIWAAVELYDRGDYVTGGIVTFFELGWYGGNIYSAVNSAHKYNERSKTEFLQKLIQAGGVAKVPANGPMVVYRFRF